MKNVLKISIFALMILCSAMVYSQTDDNANQIMQKINEAISQGDCDQAQKRYNVWKEFTQTTNASVESRIAECVKVKEDKGQQSNVTNLNQQTQTTNQQPITKGVLTVSADTVFFSSTGETKLIDVTTNAKDYEIYNLPIWLKASKQPDGNLQIFCDSNPNEKQQKGQFIIVAGDKSITVNVVQEGKEIPIPLPVETDSSTVINNSVSTPYVTEPNHNNSSSPISTSSNDYKKDVFGVDLGIGALKMYEWGTFIDLGIRWTHNFSPNIGLDIVNVKFQGYTKGSFGNDGVFHVMTGVRGYTKDFAKDMKGYATLKIGWGDQPGLQINGFAYESEIGLYLTKTVLTGFVFNGTYFADSTGLTNNSFYLGWRIGFDF